MPMEAKSAMPGPVSPPRSAPVVRIVNVLAACSVLLVSACVPVLPVPSPDPSAHRRPERIATDVPLRPGAVGWSPDGARIAFLSPGGITLVDLKTSARTSVAAPGARALAWASDNGLTVLGSAGGTDRIIRIDARDLTAESVPLDRTADAVHAVPGGKQLYLLSVRTEVHSFGTAVVCTVSALELPSGPARTLQTFERVHPVKGLDRDLITAWYSAGPNPLDRSLLVLEQVNPPAVAPYTRVLALDGAEGSVADLSDAVPRGLYRSASWSPDGNRLALTGSDGILIVRSRRGGHVVVTNAPPGWYPSWNPAGSSLYVGGSVIGTEGSWSEPLLRNAERSLGGWAPDGTQLLVNTGRELLLYRGFVPAFIPPDGPLDRGRAARLGLLQDLVGSALISHDDYQDRRGRLVSIPETMP